MKSFHIETFGCQMNEHDSERIAGVLESEGYCMANDLKEADVVVFNTCSIRQKAEQKFFSSLGKLKTIKKKKEVRIVVAGCIAQQKGWGIIRSAPYVDLVIGPQNIHLLADALKSGGEAVCVQDNPEITIADLPVSRTEGVKAWVTVMYGCNNFCSYCIVPYTRGRERSRPMRNIMDEARGLVENGVAEITLLGQNVNSYKSETDFSGLLLMLSEIVGLKRIRFVTSHPRDLSDALIHAIRDCEKVCEHIHLPLQSGSDNILKLMNRGYTYSSYKEKVDKLRENIPGIAITTDIIAGFPGEGDTDHAETIRALNEIMFDGIFAFKFSERSGTRAASMNNQVPEDVKSKRLKEILELQDSLTSQKNKTLEGTVHEILVEGPGEKNRAQLTGRTRTNKIVNFEGDMSLIGKMVFVEILRARRHSLEGKKTLMQSPLASCDIPVLI